MEAAGNTASANIVVVGSLMVDHIIITNRLPEIDETYKANSYHQALGGKGANSAIATYRSCHKKPIVVEQRETEGDAQPSDEKETPLVNGFSNDESGIEVRMVGAVGDDEHAPVFRKALADNGIDASGVRTVPGKRTAMTFITVMEESRENRVLFVAGAGEAFLPEDFTKVEHFSSTGKPDLIISQLELGTKTVEQMLETAGTAGVDVLLNAAPASHILAEKYCYITHLIVNKTEAAILSGLDLSDVKEENWEEMAQNFLAEGIQNVVITLSAEGAFYANKHGSGRVRAFKVKEIDPTGAGDTFTGTYGAEFVRQKKMGEEWDIEKAVVRACKAAAMVVSTYTAQEGIPWADEIDSFVGLGDAAAEPETEIEAGVNDLKL